MPAPLPLDERRFQKAAPLLLAALTVIVQNAEAFARSIALSRVSIVSSYSKISVTRNEDLRTRERTSALSLQASSA